jgi:hypothetical protein
MIPTKVPSLTSLEQTNPSQNRQSHPYCPRMGLLSANPRQIGARLWRPLWPPGRHWPHGRPVLIPWFHCTHRTTGMATIFFYPHRQGPSSHPHANVVSGLGHCPSMHGGCTQLRRSPCSSLLPGPFRGRLSSTLLHHHCTMVSSGRATYSCRSMVRNEWYCYNCSCRPFLRSWFDQVLCSPRVADVCLSCHFIPCPHSHLLASSSSSVL